MGLLAIADLAVTLGRRAALAGVGFWADTGTLIALAGPNGAGKSTLLKAIAGLLPYDGSIRIGGEEVSALSADRRAKQIAYLSQGRNAHWPMTVERVVAIGRLPHGATGPVLSSKDAAAVSRALNATDATALRDRRIDQLSGGERARALLARALASEAPIILADEPTEALDPAHRLQIMNALKGEATRGALIIAAMHDLALAHQYADRALLLDGGRLVAYGAPDDVLSLDRLKQVYGVTPVAGAISPLGQHWALATRAERPIR